MRLAAFAVACALVSGVQSKPAAGSVPAFSVAMAYDSYRGRLVVFGGYSAGGYIGDTWEWDGKTWAKSAAKGPSARNGPSMVYDEWRRHIVLFGGDTRETGPLGDTWTYDGTKWTEMKVLGPTPRSTHQVVYDSRRRRVVLFGGAEGQNIRGDTWEWNGENWNQVATDGPAPRTLHGLAYDSWRGRTVLFGGTGRLAPDAPSFDDTWEWNGQKWSRVATTGGPSARDHVAMGFDPQRKVVVLHGGGIGSGPSSETWTFDGKAWTLASKTGPPRRYARLAFDTRATTMLLFGGFDREPSNELWRLTPSGWTRLWP